MFGLWDETLIKADNVPVMLAIILVIVAVSIVLEQKYKWAGKITGAILCLLFAMILSNFKIIPIGSVVEDSIWSYVVPLAIPMLLFKANLTKIWKESGRLLVIFLIGALGTFIGGVIAVLTLGNILESNAVVGGNVSGLVAMMSGSYIGGGVNFAAMADAFDLTGSSLASAATVADNLLMVVYFFVLISLTTMPIMRKLYKTPLIDKSEKSFSENNGEKVLSEFWGRKEISLKDIALVFAIAASIVAVSTIISNGFSLIEANNTFIKIIVSFIGNKYLLITTFSLIIATFFPKKLDSVTGAQEFGTFLIYTFFVAIGIPASITEIIKNAPILLLFSAIMVFVNMLLTFIGAKIFKFGLEESIVASNANIGGPTTAAAIAISKGWVELVAPIMLVGTLGYVLGNYAGLIIGALAKFLGY